VSSIVRGGSNGGSSRSLGSRVLLGRGAVGQAIEVLLLVLLGMVLSGGLLLLLLLLLLVLHPGGIRRVKLVVSVDVG
jgi:hypothetical protein